MAKNEMIQKIINDDNKNDNKDENNKPNKREVNKYHRAKTYNKSKKEYNKNKNNNDLEEKLRYIEITNENNTFIDYLNTIIINNRKKFIIMVFMRKRFKLLNKQK